MWSLGSQIGGCWCWSGVTGWCNLLHGVGGAMAGFNEVY